MCSHFIPQNHNILAVIRTIYSFDTVDMIFLTKLRSLEVLENREEA